MLQSPSALRAIRYHTPPIGVFYLLMHELVFIRLRDDSQCHGPELLRALRQVLPVLANHLFPVCEVLSELLQVFALGKLLDSPESTDIGSC